VANPAASSLKVAVVQGDGTDERRWRPAHYASTLLRYAQATRQGVRHAHPDLIVWPEFAVGFYLNKNHMLRSQLGWLTRSLRAPLLLGAPRREHTPAGQHYYNSAYLLAPGGQILGVYDKMQLLPFAEYRPWGLPALLPHNTTYPSQFTAGEQTQVFDFSSASASHRLGVMICYEVTSPSLVRRLAEEGAQVLVNISNDGWLAAGGLASPAQHFSMAVIRAVENRRPLVRATTSGISGFVDPTGRPSRLSVQEQGVLLGTVIRRLELIVYTQYRDWFAWLCMGVGVLSCVWRVVGWRQAWHC
jgi:apolipoprotein N-acyltransferase